MNPDTKNLVATFSETAQRVKERLQRSGFILPVAHKGGIKFKHIWIIKNTLTNTYDIRNLHNPKKAYIENICSLRIAMAIGIYEGLQAPYSLDKLIQQDDAYRHWHNEAMFFNHTIKKSLEKGDDFKATVAETRLELVLDRLESEKYQVNSILKQAEKLLFDNK
jgi:hypothetical protein